MFILLGKYLGVDLLGNMVYQLSIYCLLAPNSPCTVIISLLKLNLELSKFFFFFFSMPVAMKLSFVSRDAGKHHRGKEFSFRTIFDLN